MTAVAVRGRHRSLLGALIGAAPSIGKLWKLVVPHVREHAVTVAAFTALDYGMFGISAGHHAAGWAVTAVTALVLDWLVRG